MPPPADNEVLRATLSTIISRDSFSTSQAALFASTPLCEQVARDGFAFVAADSMRPLLGAPAALSDWPRFAASWNDLCLDTYLPDGHRYRRRRHAALSARAGETHAEIEPN